MSVPKLPPHPGQPGDTVGVPRSQLSLAVMLVHVNACNQESWAGHSTVKHLGKQCMFILFWGIDLFYLISEQPVLAGEWEALDDAACEILERLGGETSMQRLVAAIQFGVGFFQKSSPKLSWVRWVKVHQATLEVIFALSLDLFVVTSERMKIYVFCIQHMCILSEAVDILLLLQKGNCAITRQAVLKYIAKVVWQVKILIVQSAKQAGREFLSIVEVIFLGLYILPCMLGDDHPPALPPSHQNARSGTWSSRLCKPFFCEFSSMKLFT